VNVDGNRFMPLLTSSSTLNKRKSDFSDENPGPSKEFKSGHFTENVYAVESNSTDDKITYWNAQWYAFFDLWLIQSIDNALTRRAPQYKKHKTWDGDAVLAMAPSNGGKWCMLYDGTGRVWVINPIIQLTILRLFNRTSKTKLPLLTVKKGDYFKIGDKEYEIDFQITDTDFHSGSYFNGNTSADLTPLEPLSETVLNPTKIQNVRKPFIQVRPHSTIPPKGVPLQPVNLVHNPVSRREVEEATPDLFQKTHWAINWYVLVVALPLQ
jgi:DNA repair and recombination protein RAD54B